MVFVVSSLLMTYLMLRGRLRVMRVGSFLKHYSKICLIVMRVWYVLQIGGGSLLIKKESVRKVWPILNLMMTMSWRRLNSEGVYHCLIDSLYQTHERVQPAITGRGGLSLRNYPKKVLHCYYPESDSSYVVWSPLNYVPGQIGQ